MSKTETKTVPEKRTYQELQQEGLLAEAKIRLLEDELRSVKARAAALRNEVGHLRDARTRMKHAEQKKVAAAVKDACAVHIADIKRIRGLVSDAANTLAGI